VDTDRLFKRDKPGAICAAALGEGPHDTSESPYALMEPKGMDTAETVLAKRLTNRLIHSLRMQEWRGRGKRTRDAKAVTVWRLPDL
jgi:hypothetical protein